MQAAEKKRKGLNAGTVKIKMIKHLSKRTNLMQSASADS